MKAFLREPIVHFFVAGTAFFALHAVFAGDRQSPDRIVVSEERVESLAGTFERTWMRRPTPSELRGLVDDFVTDEVFYREALALGLDRDDVVVRRRMRQKLEFLNDDLSDRAPGDEELREFLERHPERFALPERVSFEQVLVSPERHGAAAPGRAEALLVRLRADSGPVPTAAGDPTLLPRSLSNATPRDVAASFGPALAERLASLPVGMWSGPIASTFGLHLVRVTAREPGRLPALAEVRADAEREWSAEQREAARLRLSRELRSRYRVVLPPLGAAAEPERVASGS